MNTKFVYLGKIKKVDKFMENWQSKKASEMKIEISLQVLQMLNIINIQ
jgi:hypothetical protein